MLGQLGSWETFLESRSQTPPCRHPGPLLTQDSDPAVSRFSCEEVVNIGIMRLEGALGSDAGNRDQLGSRSGGDIRGDDSLFWERK